MSVRDKINKAQNEIAKILCQLEEDACLTVDGISIKDINITTISSSSGEFIRMVDIETSGKIKKKWSY